MIIWRKRGRLSSFKLVEGMAQHRHKTDNAGSKREWSFVPRPSPLALYAQYCMLLLTKLALYFTQM